MFVLVVVLSQSSSKNLDYPLRKMLKKKMFANIIKMNITNLLARCTLIKMVAVHITPATVRIMAPANTVFSLENPYSAINKGEVMLNLME